LIHYQIQHCQRDRKNAYTASVIRRHVLSWENECPSISSPLSILRLESEPNSWLRAACRVDLSSDGRDEASTVARRRLEAHHLANQRSCIGVDVVDAQRQNAWTDVERGLSLQRDVHLVDARGHHRLVLGVQRRPRAVHDTLQSRH